MGGGLRSTPAPAYCGAGSRELGRVRMYRLVVAAAVLLRWGGRAPPPALAQETRYIYDALGRLIGVVDSAGRTTLYEYDPAGNILAVQRLEASGTVGITLVNPDIGPAGTPVEIFGFGFSAAAAQNGIAFAGAAAPVTAAS